MAENVTRLQDPLQVLQGGKSDPGDDYIDLVFGPTGLLSRQIPGYKPRPGQIALARAIDKGIRERRHVIGEGPTGTGKSLAYSVPAAYHAAFKGKKACIVTANKTLQAQIVNKDLADLQTAVNWPFTYAVRKGISSYLCQRDYRDGKWRDLLFDGELTEFDQRALEETVAWAQDTETGDFEESPGPNKKIWAHFSTGRDGCDGRRCRDYDSCFVSAAKEKSAAADIVVTNYHLYYLNIQHVSSGRAGWILPPHEVGILDEAHNAANIAREFFGRELTFGAIYRCVTTLHMINVRGFGAEGKRLRTDVMQKTHELWGFLSARARANRRVLDPGDLRTRDLEVLMEQVAHLYVRLADAVDPGEGAPGRPLSSGQAQQAADANHYRSLVEKSKQVADRLAGFREAAEDGMVFFIEGSGQEEKGKWVKLKSKALHVGGYLNATLFKPQPTVVQTSATLAVKGGKSDFDYLKREMGLVGIDRVDELVVPSPFNWPKQALLVIPEDIPAYVHGSVDWEAAVCHSFEKVVRAAGGRTLGLFTSFRMLEKVRDHLRDGCHIGGVEIMAQGEATNRELQQRFREDVSSVLLGTSSFAEGVDIQGEACTCVVLDKIPFITQDDPVLKGLARTEKNVFMRYQLPEAIISFKQRIGRLVRTETDVGVIVVLDNRLLTKRYRNQFFDSIPPVRLERSLDAIGPFLRRVGAL